MTEYEFSWKGETKSENQVTPNDCKIRCNLAQSTVCCFKCPEYHNCDYVCDYISEKSDKCTALGCSNVQIAL